jgi:glycosyltransferase involved in cell wall biosynthesis
VCALALLRIVRLPGRTEASMPTITVGVPVYNGGDQLRECLDCLIKQSFSDIEIRIYDNASRDNTREISEEFARKDARVKYIRHDTNIKAMPNFLCVLRECDTEFVMWRAHDDLSAPDYIEKLYRALVAKPYINVAVPTVRTITRDLRTRVSKPSSIDGMSDLSATTQLMFNSHPGWFYGLWRRKSLLDDFQECWMAFRHPWAFDHLVLFPSLLARSVVIVPEATFIQRMVEKSYTPKNGAKPPVADMVALRRLFSAQCHRYIDRSSFSKNQKRAIRTLLPFYVGKRVYRLRKIIKRTLLGDKSPPARGTEF